MEILSTQTLIQANGNTCFIFSVVVSCILVHAIFIDASAFIAVRSLVFEKCCLYGQLETSAVFSLLLVILVLGIKRRDMHAKQAFLRWATYRFLSILKQNHTKFPRLTANFHSFCLSHSSSWDRKPLCPAKTSDFLTAFHVIKYIRKAVLFTWN